MEKSRLAFDSDENTESTEVANEVEGPKPGDPKGNPHDYIDKEEIPDGAPLDKNNPEHLSSMSGSGYKIRRAAVGFKVVFDDPEMDQIGPFDSEEDAHAAAKEEIKERTNMSELHEEANSQEPSRGGERLVGIVEHEGHSAGIHATEEGHIVKGKGSAGYLRSEPIADKEHAEVYAKEVLKAHAKLSEREICSKMTNLSEAGGSQWDGVSPKEKKEHWASLTGTAKHKLTACMNMVEGHVENPGAYCKSLAEECGYKPE